MNEMQMLVYVVRGLMTELEPGDFKKTQDLIAYLRTWLQEHGTSGQMAMILVSLESLAQDDILDQGEETWS